LLLIVGRLLDGRSSTIPTCRERLPVMCLLSSVFVSEKCAKQLDFRKRLSRTSAASIGPTWVRSNGGSATSRFATLSASPRRLTSTPVVSSGHFDHESRNGQPTSVRSDQAARA